MQTDHDLSGDRTHGTDGAVQPDETAMAKEIMIAGLISRLRAREEKSIFKLGVTPPVIRYRAWMLCQMHEKGVAEALLVETMPLPALEMYGETLPPPPVATLINCCKVFCGPNPVRYPSPTTGRTEITIAQQLYILTCTFDDQGGSRCRIRLVKT
jgi:hypothetical protein